MTTPEQPTTPAGGTSPATPQYNMPTVMAGARLPIPGNAEFAVYLFVEILFAIIWVASDSVDASLFVTITAVTTLGYLLSRGIAKASRVLEQ